MMARAAAVAIGGIPRVNLLPKSELDRRARELLVGVWARIVIATMMFTLALIGGAFAWSQIVQQGLDAEQVRTTTLLGKIGGLADVSQTLQTEHDLIAYRGQAMGADLAWAGILGKIRGALPVDVTLTGFDFTPGAAPDPTAAKVTRAATEADAAKQAADAPVGLTGTITVSSPTPREMAPYVRALRDVEGIVSADANAATTSDAALGSYVYTIDVTFDQTVYSNRYTASEGDTK
jgi:hypothetical protein